MKQVCGVWFPESDTHFKLGMIDKEGNYQKDTFDAAMSYVKEPKIFYDIGAHVGLWSLMAYRSGFKAIEAFEPNPETFSCLKKNVGEFARIFKMGVANRRRGMRINKESLSNTGALKLDEIGTEDEGDTWVCPIEMENTHEIIAECNLKPHETLVKIDTEGMEADCVLGMDKILYALRPVVCVEQRTNEEALLILQQMGMQIIKQVRKDYILTWK